MVQNVTEIIEKAATLVEALPYISAFSQKTIVIKYGGNAMNDPSTVKTIMQDVAALKIVGVKPILVHGGGPEINSMLSRVHIEPKFSEGGLRITDEKTMEIVQMVLAGKINKNVVSLLCSLGVKAVGLCGKDAELIKVRKYSPEGEDIGFVGEIVSVNGALLRDLSDDYIPVISSIGTDENGNSYNVNADTAAGAIGGEVGAEKLIFLTDIDGIRARENDPSSLISKITVDEIEKMIENGAISGGMIPKVRSCTDAIKHGIRSVQIVNGTIPHSILLELFTDSGIGTMVTA